MKLLLVFALLLAPSLGVAAPPAFDQPHLDHADGPQSVTLHGQRFTDDGLVGSGRLSAQTVDFLGDTLGSFSSLAIDQRSWRREGDHYVATLWTLPDRGRNDPDAGLFYDYAARLHRFRIRFKPYTGPALPASTQSQRQVQIVPDGGLELRDFDGRPFTGADPGAGSLSEHGIVLPSPSSGTGAGKVSIDAESLSMTADGHFYIGDEYAANVYYFDATGRLQGVITPPAAVVPRVHGAVDFNSLRAPDSGRRNNQGIEGLSLSPDGKRLFVAMQSALVQDGVPNQKQDRNNARVMVYDVSSSPTPARPIADYVVQLPTYTARVDGKPANRTAGQSEIRAINGHQFLMLSRDTNGLGTDTHRPLVYKSVLLVDTRGASNLAGSRYETSTASLLAAPGHDALRPGIVPATWVELIDMLNPVQLARFGLNLQTRPKNRPLTLSEKWEAMDLVPALDPARPDDYFLFVGNDNDFIAKHCVMAGIACDSNFDNDNMLLVYQLTLPDFQARARH